MVSAMAKTFILLFLLFTCPNSGEANGLSLKKDLKLSKPCALVIVKTKVMRKLLGKEELMDYDDPSANRSHEPRKGSPGGKA